MPEIDKRTRTRIKAVSYQLNRTEKPRSRIEDSWEHGSKGNAQSDITRAHKAGKTVLSVKGRERGAEGIGTAEIDKRARTRIRYTPFSDLSLQRRPSRVGHQNMQQAAGGFIVFCEGKGAV